MSLVEVRQIGHVAVAPVAETLSVKGRSQTKVALTVISNARWKDAEGPLKEKATSITWTLWGKVALNASWYLVVGSKVAIDGTLESRRYTNKEGKEVFSFDFTARSVQYLESKAQAEARRNRGAAAAGESAPTPAPPAAGKAPRSTASKKGA
jgi:single stranded DNA-binding protein